MNAKPVACPCGGAVYATCCGRYHCGMPAPDAVTLMRSRYSAYALRLEDFLRATWHPSTRPESLELGADNEKWLGLDIKNHSSDSTNNATVEFVARYKINGRAHRLHEISRFVREEDRWLYVDGKFPEKSARTRPTPDSDKVTP